MVHPRLAYRMGVAFLLAVLPYLGPNSAAAQAPVQGIPGQAGGFHSARKHSLPVGNAA